MRAPILELRGVRKSFGDGDRTTEILHGIDLVLQHGEFAALIGPSGSGKSTLLNLVGLLDRPSAGELLVDGQDVARLDDAGLTALRSKTLGFVFQFHHLLPALTAIENVAMPLALQHGKLLASDRAVAQTMLDAVGLGERSNQPANKLSGGQQQRVAIARALAGNPSLVLADEPTGNLDTKSADEVFELMRRFHRERATSFLIVTHDPRLAQRCDRVIEMIDGRIATGPTSSGDEKTTR